MIDRRLFTMPGIRKTLGMLAVLITLQAFSVLFQGKYLSMSIVTLWQQKPFVAVLQTFGFFLVAFVCRHLLTVLKNYVVGHWVEKTVTTLRHDVLKQVGALGPKIIQEKGTGNTVTLALEGIDKAQTYLMLVLIKMFDMMIIPWILLAYLFTVSWPEATFMLAIYPVVIIFMIILGYAAQAKADKEYANFIRLSNHFVDALRGLPTLKQLGLSRRYATNIHRVSEDYRKSVLSTLKIAILSTFTLDFFTTLSIAIVAVFLGFSLIDGTKALLPALTMLVLAPEYFLPLRNFANDYHDTLDGKNALGDVLDLLSRPTLIDNQQLKLEQWNTESHLTLDNVTIAYNDNDEPTLTIEHLALQGYQKVGIIGRSGSGKSNLLNLLGGFLAPTNNEKQKIMLNKQPVEHLQLQAWQKQFQYIPQTPYIFHATLAENVAFYAPDASEEAIILALEAAGLATFWQNLPNGLATLIGEGGQAVSGGQAQRIALARAFLTPERRVLLFDEPTAHLDIETEMNIKKAIIPLFENHLVLFATHRLHWVKQMDYVLVIEDGKIVEQGTPDELASRGGAFVRLVADVNQLGGVK